MNIQAGYIYGFRLTSRKAELIKIGMTNNVERRLAELNGQLHATRMPGHLTLVQQFSYRTATTRQAHQVEQEAHRLAVEYRDEGGGEWFAMSAQRAQEYIEAAAAAVNVRIVLVFDRTKTAAQLRVLDEESRLAELVARRQAEVRRLEAEDKAKKLAEHEAREIERLFNLTSERDSADILKTQAEWEQRFQAERTDKRKRATTGFLISLAFALILIWVISSARSYDNTAGGYLLLFCAGFSCWFFWNRMKLPPDLLANKNERARQSFNYVLQRSAEGYKRDARTNSKSNPSRSRIYQGVSNRIEALRISIPAGLPNFHVLVSELAANGLNVLTHERCVSPAPSLEASRQALQDRYATLYRIQQQAGISSKNVELDTLGALDRMGRRLISDQLHLVDQPMARIEGILVAAGYTAAVGRKALDDLLVARHVPEYNAHIAMINPVEFKPDGTRLGGYDLDQNPGSGISDAQARDTIRLLTGQDNAKTKALLEAEHVYRQMIRDLQIFAVDRGIEKQETIDAWNKKFPNYAPLRREMDLEENVTIGTASGASCFSLRSGIAREAMSSSADITSPLASTMLWGLKTTQRGENAIVARTFLAFAKAFVPNYMTANRQLKPMWTVKKIPNQRVVKRLNVYLVTKADGTVSPEFYNQKQANAYADMQQALWVQQNPDKDPAGSIVEVQRPYNEPQNRVIIQPTPNYLSESNVMVIPVEGENVIITFDMESTDARSIVEAFNGSSRKEAA